MMNQNFDGEFRAFLFNDVHNIYVISFGLYHMNHIIWGPYYMANMAFHTYLSNNILNK